MLTLDLSGNRITDVSPLGSLTNLTVLSILGSPDGNQITDISALGSLTNLTQLRLWNNQISDISPLISLTKLRTLWILQGNHLSIESMNVYIPQLEERGVEVH